MNQTLQHTIAKHLGAIEAHLRKDVKEQAKIIKRLEAIEATLQTITQAPQSTPHITGGFKAMFVVKDDNPDVSYSISAASAVDAEGNAIPDAQLTYETVSDNPAAVAITPDSTGLAGTVKFGSPGLANINVTVSFNGALLGSFGAQFTVTTGDPAAISGGSIEFNGLTES